MKKGFRFLLVILASIASIMSVNAKYTVTTSTKTIDRATCEASGNRVYTNYYLFLEANEESTFKNSDLNKFESINRKIFSNTKYETAIVSNNVGYGAGNFDGKNEPNLITDWGYVQFYEKYKKALESTNGIYSYYGSNYMIYKNYAGYQNGTWINKNGFFDVSNISNTDLIHASLGANINIVRLSEISNNVTDVQFEISRNKYNFSNTTPVSVGNQKWYFQPAVYYIQYCGKKVDYSTPTKPTPTQTSREYHINYVANGTNVYNMPRTNYFDENTCTNISSLIPTREGYTFLGWSRYSTSTTGESAYNPKALYCGGNLTLYAIWKKNDVKTYTVVYDKNTTDIVTNMPNNIVANVTEDVVLAKEIPVRDGYTFLGWALNKDATSENTAFNGGNVYKDRKDLTLYAVWKKNEAQVIPENPKTGIEDYLLPFGGAIILAIGLLAVLKKKKPYLQF